MNSPVFSETQRFAPIWSFVVFLSTIPVYVVLIFSLNQQLVKGKPFGNHPMSDEGLLIFSVCIILFTLGTVLLFASCRLITRYSRDGIEYRFFPFQIRSRLIRWSDVEKAWIREYRPVAEYGGWGIRYSFRNGRAYNISGRWGVQLALKNGRKMLIGTRQKDRLAEILKELAVQ